LRNPLAPVRNAVQILQLHAGADPGSQRANEIIARQVAVMARLIDDLMDVSRINRGHIALRREPVALSRILELAIEATRPYVTEFDHQLSVALPDGEIVLDADVTRLSQVFVNLLTNAAKYTDRGGHIQVTVEREDAAVRIEVRDDGIGIPIEHLHSVFAMFAQVDGAITRSRGGLGIGLSLVKHLVELHGGHIVAHSAGPGTGSSFVVTLPMAAHEHRNAPAQENADHASAPAPPVQSRPRKILVVDDHRDGAETITELLSRLGHDVRTAHDGSAAILAADDFRPDLILLDIGLPTLSGYDVCRHIREQPWAAGTTVVAMTGWGDQEAQRKARAAGFDRHLVKPIDEDSLKSALALDSSS
jgi:CheY-like chemotaxis protein/two-component sensor histidine kinase